MTLTPRAYGTALVTGVGAMLSSIAFCYLFLAPILATNLVIN